MAKQLIADSYLCVVITEDGTALSDIASKCQLEGGIDVIKIYKPEKSRALREPAGAALARGSSPVLESTFK